LTADPERIADLADVLSDPRRVRILQLLTRSPATVSEIGEALGFRASETSLQLAPLRRLDLARVVRRGRHRIYSVDPDATLRLLEPIAEFSHRASAGRRPPGGRGLPSPTRDPGLRQARLCYDHLAGLAGVELAAGMERLGWIVASPTDYLVTARGEQELLRRGVDVAVCRDSRRKLAPGCLDWTERRAHVGGALGAAILRQLASTGYVRLGTQRHVRVRRPVDEWLKSSKA
jgi:DNA-binding transcriptional ArsR family regulator